MSTVEVSKEPGAAGTQCVPALPGSPGEGWLCPSQGRVDSCRAVCLEIEQYSLATREGRFWGSEKRERFPVTHRSHGCPQTGHTQYVCNPQTMAVSPTEAIRRLESELAAQVWATRKEQGTAAKQPDE